MFDSGDWIFEDALNEDDVEEETKRKSHLLCQTEEQISFVKRRKVNNCQVLSSLPTDSTFRQSELDIAANVENNDSLFKNKNKNDASRGDLLGSIFQENISPQTFDFVREIDNDPLGMKERKTQYFQSKAGATSKMFQREEPKEKSYESMTEEKFAKEVKLIRIFPGPAGLVSAKNNNISAASCVSNVEELEKNKTTTKHMVIKSQSEKNSIGEKAWKFLLNDLPKDFLQDYKISTVKGKANASHCETTKVKFIAGILDYIDHSYDDPFVILKDTTASIEGTIHRDILLRYPGILEPNVVILLRDVGLLKTTTYVVTHKYHILVSLVNLLAIYSDKGRIVSTSFMESGILSHTSNIELNRINDRMPVSKPIYITGLQKMDKNRNASWQASFSIDSSSPRIKRTHELEFTNDPLLHPTNEKYESCGKHLKDDKNCKVTDEIHEFNYSICADDLDSTHVFLTTDYDFTTSEEQNCFDDSLCKNTSVSRASEIQRCNLQVEDMKHLEEESTINFQKRMKEQTCHRQKRITDIKTCETDYSRKNCFSFYDEIACKDSNVNVRSTEILPGIKRNIENSKALISYFTNDKKCDEYDSDDEILSQLDVDNVFDEPKRDR